MDTIDLKLVKQLQKQADIALIELSRRLKISKTTCWNRIQRLEERGIISGKYTQFNREELGLSVVVFMSITVGRHSPEWVNRFIAVVEKCPEIVEAHRLTGEGADYQLKIVCPDITAYDAFQQNLINDIEFTSMSSKISLKEIKWTHHLPLSHLEQVASDLSWYK